jgi:hypothetical protein
MIKQWQTFSFSGKSINCYGLEVVRHTLKSKDISCVPYDKNTKEPVLVSLYWPEQLYNYVRWRFRSCNINRDIVVGGNYPSTSPGAIVAFDTNVFMGEGEKFNGTLEGVNFAKRGEPKEKAVADTVVPLPYEDVQTTRRSFCEISRGCRNKCLFCQYGWLKPYREANLTDIIHVCKRASTKSIRVFAADRFAHSNYFTIRQELKSIGKNDTGSDVSMRFMFKNPQYLQFTNKIRVGIEGCSERLRRLVGKPFTDEKIVEFCKMIVDAGIKSLDWYMIYGLPTETKEDHVQFRELLKKLDAELPTGYVIAIHWNAFTPSAQTPFQWAAPAQVPENYPELAKMFNLRENHNIKIYHKPRFTGEWTLIRRMLAIRANEGLAKLIYNFAFGEAKFKKNPKTFLRLCEKEAGYDIMQEWPVDRPFPWDEYCLYRKDLMLRLWCSRVLKQADVCVV